MAQKSKTSSGTTAKTKSITTRKRSARTQVKRDEVSDESDQGSEFSNNGVNESVAADTDEGLDSDALDESPPPPPTKKRKVVAAAKVHQKGVPRKKRKSKVSKDDDYDDDLEEGQEIVGQVVKAPTTGRVPPGQISQNTLDFLTKLADPECNDRTWFKLHDPVFRQAETEFKAFVEAFTDVLSGVDPEIPPLPPRDVIHRIYRDVRFSNDKTPYKRSLSATFSRSGRKGIFACYHLSVRPGGQSMIAAGTWCPGKDELANIRTHILRNPTRLRGTISTPAFAALFGAAKPSKKAGEVQNIFGREDELKNAPKGIAKDHKDIDLLKCRTFAVVKRFEDHEVLEPGWKEELGRVCEVMRPFVRLLNDMMTVPNDGSEEERAGNNDEDNSEVVDDRTHDAGT